MNTTFCPQCETVERVSPFEKAEVLKVLGEDIEYRARLFKCDKCGSEFATPEQEKRNFKIAYDIYRERHNLLSPERIRAIREKYGLSQRSFGKFLGWGDITIHRYESGSIQDASHNEMLALIESPVNALKVLELNKNELKPKVYAQINERIHRLLADEAVMCMCHAEESMLPPSENNGFTQFDIEKYENLVLLLVDKIRPMFKTKLNKLLWYCDFLHYKKHSVSITGATYYSYPYGPVAANYEGILNKLCREGDLTVEEVFFDGYSGEQYSGEQYSLRGVVDSSLFNPGELDTINQVITKLGEFGSRKLSDISHEEEGYKETKRFEAISYDYAKYLSL